jgi:ribosomal protein L11
MFAIKSKICLFIRSQNAETGPPLGTVLGNLGVNAPKFVKEFNDFTKELPSYFVLKVFVYVLEDRSFTFSVFLSTTSYFLTFVKFSKNNLSLIHKEYCITLKNVIQLALFKFPTLSLQKSLPIILGTVISSKLVIVF